MLVLVLPASCWCCVVKLLVASCRRLTRTAVPRAARPAAAGVCHVALAQEGHCKPGEVLFGTDSHTCNAGAFGQFATGVGNTDAGFILGTGKLLIKVRVAAWLLSCVCCCALAAACMHAWGRAVQRLQHRCAQARRHIQRP